MAKRRKNSVTDGGTDLVFTISTLLPKDTISAWGRRFLNDYSTDYNCATQEILSLMNHGVITPESTPGEIRHASPHALRLPSRMVNAGIYQVLTGQHASQREVDKAFLEVSEFKFHEVEKRIAKLKKAKKTDFLDKNKRYTATEKAKALKAGLESLDKAHKEHTSRKNRLAEAEKRYADTHLRQCFGGRTLLRQRSKIGILTEPDNLAKLETWRSEWKVSRYGKLFFVGSSDETMGCSNAHVVWRVTPLEEQVKILEELRANKNLKRKDIKRKRRELEGQFFLKITVPTYYRDTYEHTKLEIPIDIGMYAKELRSHIFFHETTDKGSIKEQKLKSSLSVRLMQKVNGDYAARITINTNQQASSITTNRKQGVLGVDFNHGHFDMVEVDKHGNFLKYQLIEADLKGLSSKHRTTVLSEATLKMVLLAKKTGKSLFLEDLDFSNKKACLSKEEGLGAGYNRMLSEFPYAKAVDFICMQCYKHGVELLFVDPSYTSQIGEVKYASRFGLDRHGAAAMVIARRGMGFKERLPVVDSVPTPKKVRGEASHHSDTVAKKNSEKKAPVMYVWQPRGLLITPKRNSSKECRSRQAVYFKVRLKKNLAKTIPTPQKSSPFLSRVA